MISGGSTNVLEQLPLHPRGTATPLPRAPQHSTGDRRPQRIQLRRTKGWKLPEGAVVVSRPTKWGNPFKVDITAMPAGKGAPLAEQERKAREIAVSHFRLVIEGGRYPTRTYPGGPKPLYPSHAEIRAELAGHNLACWCPLSEPCHAEVLLDLANPTTEATL